jgi:hypothetical protein
MSTRASLVPTGALELVCVHGTHQGISSTSHTKTFRVPMEAGPKMAGEGVWSVPNVKESTLPTNETKRPARLIKLDRLMVSLLGVEYNRFSHSAPCTNRHNPGGM